MDVTLMKRENQAAAFFRSQPGFKRLFTLLIQKYQSLGKIGGSVKLERLDDEEVQSLASFLRVNVQQRDVVRISFEQFAAALRETCFGDIYTIDLLEAYHGAPLISNQQRRAVAKITRQQFFSELLASAKGPWGAQWLNKVAAKAPGTRRAQLAYGQGNLDNMSAFKMVLSALDNAPSDYVRLPVFAQRITGHPHAFDHNTSLGRILLEALRLIAERQENTVESDEAPEFVTSVEQEAELLYAFKILRDDLLNFVTCTGLEGCGQKSGYQTASDYWRPAWERSAVLNVPLREIVRYTYFAPVDNCTGGRQAKKVFIVENSGVFSAIVDRAAEQEAVLPSLVCLHGQFKLASWALLDRLVAGGSKLYYSGDFDPEGLVMADRLIKRYSDRVRLWRYSCEDYSASLGDNDDGSMTDVISDKRLKQLDGVSTATLCSVAACLKKTKCAGYQEGIVERLMQDCLRELK